MPTNSHAMNIITKLLASTMPSIENVNRLKQAKNRAMLRSSCM